MPVLIYLFKAFYDYVCPEKFYAYHSLVKKMTKSSVLGNFVRAGVWNAIPGRRRTVNTGFPVLQLRTIIVEIDTFENNLCKITFV